MNEQGYQPDPRLLTNPYIQDVLWHVHGLKVNSSKERAKGSGLFANEEEKLSEFAAGSAGATKISLTDKQQRSRFKLYKREIEAHLRTWDMQCFLEPGHPIHGITRFTPHGVRANDIAGHTYEEYMDAYNTAKTEVLNLMKRGMKADIKQMVHANRNIQDSMSMFVWLQGKFCPQNVRAMFDSAQQFFTVKWEDGESLYALAQRISEIAEDVNTSSVTNGLSIAGYLHKACLLNAVMQRCPGLVPTLLGLMEHINSVDLGKSEDQLSLEFAELTKHLAGVTTQMSTKSTPKQTANWAGAEKKHTNGRKDKNRICQFHVKRGCLKGDKCDHQHPQLSQEQLDARKSRPEKKNAKPKRDTKSNTEQRLKDMEKLIKQLQEDGNTSNSTKEKRKKKKNNKDRQSSSSSPESGESTDEYSSLARIMSATERSLYANRPVDDNVLGLMAHDTGGTSHYVRDAALFKHKKKLAREVKITCANGDILIATHVGAVSVHVRNLEGCQQRHTCKPMAFNAYYVPDITQNLLSGSKLDDDGISQTITDGVLTLRDAVGNVIAEAMKDNNAWTLLFCTGPDHECKYLKDSTKKDQDSTKKEKTKDKDLDTDSTKKEKAKKHCSKKEKTKDKDLDKDPTKKEKAKKHSNNQRKESSSVTEDKDGDDKKVTNVYAEIIKQRIPFRDCTPAEREHRRLGHQHYKRIKRSRKTTTGIKHVRTSKHDRRCAVCDQAHAQRAPVPARRKNRSKTPGACQASDTFENAEEGIFLHDGYVQTGAKHCCSYTDEATGMRAHYFQKTLSAEETAANLEHHIIQEEATGHPLKVLTTDGGTSYKGAVKEVLTKHKIAHKVTEPYEHESNGLAESSNLHTQRQRRRLMIDQDAPAEFWCMAVRHGTWIANRMDSKDPRGKENTRPTSAWERKYGRKPDVSGVPTWLARGTVTEKNIKRKLKMHPRGTQAYFLGMNGEHKRDGMIAWLPELQTIVVTHNCVYDDTRTYQDDKTLYKQVKAGTPVGANEDVDPKEAEDVSDTEHKPEDALDHKHEMHNRETEDELDHKHEMHNRETEDELDHKHEHNCNDNNAKGNTNIEEETHTKTGTSICSDLEDTSDAHVPPEDTKQRVNIKETKHNQDEDRRGGGEAAADQNTPTAKEGTRGASCQAPTDT